MQRSYHINFIGSNYRNFKRNFYSFLSNKQPGVDSKFTGNNSVFFVKENSAFADKPNAITILFPSNQQELDKLVKKNKNLFSKLVLVVAPENANLTIKYNFSNYKLLSDSHINIQLFQTDCRDFSQFCGEVKRRTDDYYNTENHDAQSRQDMQLEHDQNTLRITQLIQGRKQANCESFYNLPDEVTMRIASHVDPNYGSRPNTNLFRLFNSVDTVSINKANETDRKHSNCIMM